MGYKLKLLTPETMKLLGSGKKDIDKDGENEPKLGSAKVVLVHCNLVKKDYQHASNILFTFVPNKQFGQLINISPHSLTMMNTINIEFSFAEVWFIDQVSKALEIQIIYLTIIIGSPSLIKMRYSTEPKFKKYFKAYGFLPFGKKYDKKIWNATKTGIDAAKTAFFSKFQRVVQKMQKQQEI